MAHKRHSCLWNEGGRKKIREVRFTRFIYTQSQGENEGPSLPYVIKSTSQDPSTLRNH